MNCALRCLAVFACAAALGAQTPPPAPAAPPAQGLEADWDIAPVLQQIGEHAARLLPVLDRIDVPAWVAKGASETYAAQLQSCKEQTRAIAGATHVLTRNPDVLSGSLELYFRIEALEIMLGSLQEGMRKYQSPLAAQELEAMVAQNGASRGRFERYIVNLAQVRERDYQVMDREAQRCRGTLATPVRSSQNAKSSPGKKK